MANISIEKKRLHIYNEYKQSTVFIVFLILGSITTYVVLTKGMEFSTGAPLLVLWLLAYIDVKENNRVAVMQRDLLAGLASSYVDLLTMREHLTKVVYAIDNHEELKDKAAGYLSKTEEWNKAVMQQLTTLIDMDDLVEYKKEINK